MDPTVWAPYVGGVAAVLVALVQTRARAVEQRKARGAKRRAQRLEAEHEDRSELVAGWRELVDASREQWHAISTVLSSVREELAACEDDRHQFVIDIARIAATQERHEAILAGRIPPPHP